MPQGERLSRAETHLQRQKLQTLLMEAFMTDLPEFGLLLSTDEPEYLGELLARAKQNDPALRNMIIGHCHEGVIIYHDQSKDVGIGHRKRKETSNDEEDSDARDGQTHSDL